jgi:hypothetical protein
MNKSEPPSSRYSSASLFLVGKDRDGHWVVQGPKGLCGGLFIGRAEAVKFAMYESGKRPQAIIMVPGTLELDMSGRPSANRGAASDRRIGLSSAAA